MLTPKEVMLQMLRQSVKTEDDIIDFKSHMSARSYARLRQVLLLGYDTQGQQKEQRLWE